jgi:hypothetical protein
MRLSIVPATVTAALVLGGSMWVDAGYPMPELRGRMVVPVVAPDTTPAFPGAKGYGATSLDRPRDSVRAGAWPLYVWDVSNTNNSGAGSFRQAIQNCADSSSALNYVTFSTGGKITLSTDIDIAGINNCYIAGQTAPGGGITITGERWRIRNGANNLVVRYLTWASQASFNILVEDCIDCVFDHISLRLSAKVGGANLFSVDVGQIATPGETLERTTISSNLLAFPDTSHPTVLAIDGDPHSSPHQRLVTLYQNFMAGPGHRMPSVVMGDTIGVYQNVWYNWQDRPGQVAESGQWYTHWSGNYSKTGPATPASGWKRDYALISRNLSCNTTGGDGTCDWSWRVDSHRASQTGYDETISADSLWRGSKRIIACQSGTGSECTTDGDTVPIDRQGARLPIGTFQPDTTALTDAKLTILTDSVGNAQGVDSLGNWVYRRDAFDTARVLEFNDSTGPSAIVAVDTFTVATPATGTAGSDADVDGLPDAWEALHGVSVNTADEDADGWNNVDEYIHGMDPNVFNDADGVASNQTYGSTIYIYRSKSTAQDTLCFDATGLATTCPAIDTMIVRTWDGDSIPSGGVGRACWDADSVRYFVSKSAIGGNLLDSLAADTLLADVIQAGCDTASVKNAAEIPG